MTGLTASDWLLLAAAGLLATGGFLLRLRMKLLKRGERRPRRNAWRRGALPLAGLTGSILLTGFFLGAATIRGLEDGGLRGSVLSGRKEGGIRLHSWRPAAPVSSLRPSPLLPGETSVSPSPPVAAEIPAPDDSTPGGPDEEVPLAGGLAVRIGVYSNPDNARRAEARLVGWGFQPLRRTTTTTEGDRRYWVYAGRFQTSGEAREVTAALRERGQDARVVRWRDETGG